MIIKNVSEMKKGTGKVKNEEGLERYSATIASATVSRNFVEYREQSLSTLTGEYSESHDGGYDGAPVFIDHKIHTAEAVIGKVTNVKFLEGRLTADLLLQPNHPITEKVRLGLLKNVSFHNKVTGLTCSICGKEYGKECREHRLGEKYKDKVCHMIPQKLGAIEVSVVSFGGIPNARIGETLEGFDERINFYDNNEDESEDVVIDTIKQETNESNDTFISQEEKDLNRETSNEIDSSINEEANKMSEDKTVEFQQSIEKLELEKQNLLEEKEAAVLKVSELETKEQERLQLVKESLIAEIGKFTKLTEEKLKIYAKFDISALKELLDVVQNSTKPIPSEGTEPMPKAVVSTLGENDVEDPEEKRAKAFLSHAL